MLTVDFMGFTSTIPPGIVNYDGGNNPGDALAIVNLGATDVDAVINGNIAGQHKGSFLINGPGTGGAGNNVINYIGIQPASVTGNITNLFIDLPEDGTDNGATLEDNGNLADGISRVRAANPSGAFETTQFSNPTNSLTVNAHNDGETVTVNGMDPAFSPGGVQPFVINGGTGNDVFNITPLVGSTISIDGGPPAVFPGDTLNYSGPGSILPTVPGAGTVTQAGFEDVIFSNIEVAFTSLFSVVPTPGGLVVTGTGDKDFPNEDDEFVVQNLFPTGQSLAILLNGAMGYFGSQAAVLQINTNGLGGNDDLTVDSSNGLIQIPNGIRYDGGLGRDSLKLTQTGGATQTSDVYRVGPNPGEGSSVITGPSGAQKVYFENLAPVVDFVPAATLTVVGTPADNAINYGVGSVPANGLVTIDNFESIEFSNKDHLIMDGGQGNNQINVKNPNIPTGATPGGLKDIALVNGNPTFLEVTPLAFSAVEGTPFAGRLVATFTDPANGPALPGVTGNYSATINWGDGASSAGTIGVSGGLFTVTGGHTYAEETETGPNAVKVTVSRVTVPLDPAPVSVQVTAWASVSDPAVVAAPVAVAAVEGEAFVDTPVATFTDPGGTEPVDDYSALIDWGDGAPASHGKIIVAGGTFSVLGSHLYGEEGSYAVTVSIHHETAQSVVLTAAATVSDPPVAPLGGFSMTLLEGTSSGLQTVATFTDPGGAEPNPSDPGPISAHYSADIDWGDGTGIEIGGGTITGPDSKGVFSVVGSHTYATAGTYDIDVYVHHELAPDPLPVTDTATVLGTGVTVVDGVLWVVGTDGNDKIEVEPWSKATGHMAGKKGQIHVEGIPFLPGKYHEMNFNPAGVTRVEVLARGGADFVQIEGSLKIPGIIDGGTGNDKLISGIAGAIVLGGGGNDTLVSDFLQGVQGFSILVGGNGSDKLYNKSNRGSILIGGTTDYDYDAFGLPNDVALNKLLKEWASGASYGDRVHYLRAGDGLNSPLKLDATTVHRETAAKDQFFQQAAGLTWYFAHITGGATPYDSISGKKNSESVFALNF